MPGLLIAAAVAATVSATPVAPTALRADVEPRSRAAIQFSVPPAALPKGVEKVCGMRMVIGDASIDRGILMGATRVKKAESKVPDDNSCGSVKLVTPVNRQR